MKRYDLDTGWMFRREGGGEVPVDLPHDAMQTEPREPDSPTGSGCAYYRPGLYTYTRVLHVPASAGDRVFVLELEGLYPFGTVYLNGREIGRVDYGYGDTLIPLALGPGENELTVTADNRDVPNSRWYSGAGLHRPVGLWVGAREHIEPYGVRVRTVSTDAPEVEITVLRTGSAPALAEVLDGNRVLGSVEVGDGSARLALPGAELWSEEFPKLYTCRVTLPSGDAAEARFGIRTVAWGPEGFFVNGVPTLLRGGCIHHDNGILGARTYPEAERRRVRIMKTFGFNALRSAHNPMSRYLLEACDEAGMYVMDEGWDMWYSHKNPGDYASRFGRCRRADLESMVRRDYCHPSVVMYSIGNEIGEPVDDRGLELARELVDTLHALDPTRPVTAGANLVILHGAWLACHSPQGHEWHDPDVSAMDSTAFNEAMMRQFGGMTEYSSAPGVDEAVSPFLDLLDIAGYNYASSRYPGEGERHPGRVLVGSETFPAQLAENWAAVEKYPYLIGDFMWTAWDYLGEAGIGAWSPEPDAKAFAKPYPWLLGDTGAFDILGNDNAEAGLAAVVWRAMETPYIAVSPVVNSGRPVYKGPWRGTDAIPSWSWRGCEGREATVEVYARAARVRLSLNGETVGEVETQGLRAAFTVPYAPGVLTALALDGEGQVLSRSSLISAAGDLRVCLTPEGPAVRGRPLYVDVDIIGENGELEANADTRLEAHVGGGRLLAFGSAKPRTELDFQSGVYDTWYGQALAVIVPEERRISLTVRGGGLEAKIELDVSKNPWRGE